MAKNKKVKAQNQRKKKTKVRKADTFSRKVFQTGFWKRNAVGAAIIFILGFGLYLRTLNYEYVLDDQIVVTKNVYVEKGFGGIWDILSTESFQGYFQAQKDLVVGARYRPLSIVTFAIERGILGKNSRQVSHFINALLYGLTGLLLFRILHLFFFKEIEDKWYLGLGFGAALLWTLHPLHTEAVANVKGRDEIMALIGSLATLYYTMKYVEKGKVVSIVMACLSFFLGLLSKETTITFLGVIPLSIYFFQTGKTGKILKANLPLLGVFVLYLVIRVSVIGYLLGDTVVTDIMNNPFAEMSVGQKYATVFYTLLIYLKLCFVPHPLTHDYYPFHIPTMEWSDFLPILSLLLYSAMGLYALLSIRKRSIPSYAILFYLMTISIVSNLFFPIGTFMNERFVYMASIGACIAIGWILLEAFPRWINGFKPLYGSIILAIIALSYGYKTFSRIPAWKSPLSLNASAIKVSKNSARANVFTGTAWFNQYKEMPEGPEKDRALELAGQYVRRAKELYPSYHNANLMLAGVLAEEYKDDGDLAKLLDGFANIARTNPRVAYVFEFLDYLKGRGYEQEIVDFYFRTGKTILIDQELKFNEGLNYLQRGLNVDPNNQRLLEAMAQTYEQLGNSSKAQEFYNRMR
ncbi:tetratricopeptide repeat protein [Portibacter marinus]|uniref:tetratricopeptide repeat protein n=1 Tax=Portibacter marinus TaxID=2898660 RepID=UPI001F4874C9|nr:tetratricopeptide repeat protein [Portibacter marinus]